jgi:hypothetical protein
MRDNAERVGVSKKKKAQKTPGDVVLETLNHKIVVTRKGKKLQLSAFEAALEACFEKASRGDQAAQKTMEQILLVSGFYEKEPENSPHGVIVVYATHASRTAWLAKARATKQTINPLEGIPGAEEFTMDRKFGGEEHEDPTGN